MPIVKMLIPNMKIEKPRDKACKEITVGNIKMMHVNCKLSFYGPEIWYPKVALIISVSWQTLTGQSPAMQITKVWLAGVE